MSNSVHKEEIKEVMLSVQKLLDTLTEEERKEVIKKQGYEIAATPKVNRERFKTCKEASKMCIYSEPVLRKLCKNSNKNNFPCIHIGKRIYIDIERLNDWTVDHLGQQVN